MIVPGGDGVPIFGQDVELAEGLAGVVCGAEEDGDGLGLAGFVAVDGG
ncbi:MAG: hypothetical protein WBA10_14485 [Elainellaceae cyanobacterium]